jgi:hypothetical protein
MSERGAKRPASRAARGTGSRQKLGGNYARVLLSAVVGYLQSLSSTAIRRLCHLVAGNRLGGIVPNSGAEADSPPHRGRGVSRRRKRLDGLVSALPQGFR